jgi:hypothetical protein
MTHLSSFAIGLWSAVRGQLQDSLFLALVLNICKLWAQGFETFCLSDIATRLARVHVGSFPLLGQRS